MTLGTFSSHVKFTPWWWEAVPPRPRVETNLPAEADVAVIGSGYTGLTAALTLARAGRQVVVIEANAPGYGASTRNGGQVGSGNQKFTVEKLIAIHGEKKARDLINEGLAMLRHIGEFIERENIECHFSRVGRLRAAVTPAHYESLACDMEDLHRIAGVEFYMVPRSEQRAEIGSDYYHGGAVLPNDAALHPALYHRGILERAEAAGVEVVPFTPVTEVSLEGGEATVHTARGRLKARAVVVTTNGYTDGAFPILERRIVPIGSAIIATEELDAQVIERLIPNRRVIGSSTRIYNYYRVCPEGKRILFGGRVRGWSAPDDPESYVHLYRDMVRVFPELDGSMITHCWSGYVAYTHDILPHLGFRDGVYYAMGYCGTGVARSTYFGHKIALKVLGDKDGDTPFDDIAFPVYPMHFLAARSVPLAVAWYRIRDRLERER